MTVETQRPERDGIIREAECLRLSGLSRQTRWRLSRQGQFPKPRQISRGAKGWLASEIADWLASRKVAEAAPRPRGGRAA
jgi:prophage regulatory protein